MSASTLDTDTDVEVGRYGLRTFGVDTDQALLLPLSVRNPAGEAPSLFAKAWIGGTCIGKCMQGKAHDVPADDCTCGVYAATNLTGLLEQYPGLAHQIVAVIAAEGQTIIGDRGMRTAAARVVAYWVHPSAEAQVHTVVATHCATARRFDDLDAMVTAYGLRFTPQTGDSAFTAGGFDAEAMRQAIGTRAAAARFVALHTRRRPSGVAGAMITTSQVVATPFLAGWLMHTVLFMDEHPAPAFVLLRRLATVLTTWPWVWVVLIAALVLAAGAATVRFSELRGTPNAITDVAMRTCGRGGTAAALFVIGFSLAADTTPPVLAWVWLATSVLVWLCAPLSRIGHAVAVGADHLRARLRRAPRRTRIALSILVGLWVLALACLLLLAFHVDGWHQFVDLWTHHDLPPRGELLPV